jgi:hypothetical protein
MMLRMRKGSFNLLPLVCAASLGIACTPNTTEVATSDASSPQASAMPAPLSPGVGNLSGEQASVLRGDELIPSDVPQPLPKEGALALEATFRPLDLPAIARNPEANPAQLEQARRKIEARLIVLLGSGRMRARLDGSGFLLPDGVELRSRTDKLGHIVMYAGGARYRTVGPGALRSFFGEGRYDVVPFRAVRTGASSYGFRLGMRTRNVELSTERGKMVLELARPVEGLDAGGLVCRMLLELLGASPSASPCSEAEVPVRAEIRWSTRGGILFEASKLSRRADVSSLAFATPPATAEGSLFELPLADNRTLFSESELAQFQTIQDVPVSPDAPKGLLLSNRTDLARVVWVNGVPVAQVAAQRAHLLQGLPKGRYSVIWRSALDDRNDGPFIVTAPGKSEIGTQDPPGK